MVMTMSVRASAGKGVVATTTWLMLGMTGRGTVAMTAMVETPVAEVRAVAD